MTRPTTLMIAVLVALSTSAVTTVADEPLLIRSLVDITVPQPGLSALCGFKVYRRVEGLVDVALFLDDEGKPLHEIDTSPSLRYTFFSSETGKSVSYPGTGTLITDYYQDGMAVASVDGHLALVHASGGAPLLINVGRLVFTAEVIGVNADGVPVIGPPIDVLFEAGIDHGSILGACQALAP